MAELEETEGAEGRIETSRDELGIPVIRITGEIDLANAASMRRAIDPIVSTRPERLIIDASGLDFMDSSGIALLLSCAQTAGRVELRHPSRIIRRTVESMGLVEILHLEP